MSRWRVRRHSGSGTWSPVSGDGYILIELQLRGPVEDSKDFAIVCSAHSHLRGFCIRPHLFWAPEGGPGFQVPLTLEGCFTRLLHSCHSSGSSYCTAHYSPHVGGQGFSLREMFFLRLSLTAQRTLGVASPFPDASRGLWCLSCWARRFNRPLSSPRAPGTPPTTPGCVGGAVLRGMPLFWFPGRQISPRGPPLSRRSGPGHRAPTRGPAFPPRLSFPSGWNPGGTPLKAPRAPRRHSAWAPARPTPLQLAAGTPHAAHLSRGSGGASPQGDPLKRLPRCSGGSRRIPSSRRFGRRSSGSAPPGMCAVQPGAPGAPLVGQGSAAPPVHGARALRPSAESSSFPTAPRASTSGARSFSNGPLEAVQPWRPF
ncbi:hypothetical protein NDU88_005968 [Pleurodeles waltl]|uniref:Uncharacterized protein n=1 Tax=Pleurodeles waltl TaxID=8319 RepID=A0AAV7MZJ0_PLEWA|nr:hypothetical protein NDU88_005968 [Pleurodeles waltl]